MITPNDNIKMITPWNMKPHPKKITPSASNMITIYGSTWKMITSRPSKIITFTPWKMITSCKLENDNILAFTNDNIYTMKNDKNPLHWKMNIIFQCRECLNFSWCKCYHFWRCMSSFSSVEDVIISWCKYYNFWSTGCYNFLV